MQNLLINATRTLIIILPNAPFDVTIKMISSPKEILLRAQGAILEFQAIHEKRALLETADKPVNWVIPPMG
jgi:hypothetical protein